MRTICETTKMVLDHYRNRGVLRITAAYPYRSDGTLFKVRWHYGRDFDFVTSRQRGEICIRSLFPDINTVPNMKRDLVSFLKGFSDNECYAHRIVDVEKCIMKILMHNRNRDASIVVNVIDNDFEYAAKALIRVLNEIFMRFLLEGPFYDYQVKTLQLHPDAITAG